MGGGASKKGEPGVVDAQAPPPSAARGEPKRHVAEAIDDDDDEPVRARFAEARSRLKKQQSRPEVGKPRSTASDAPAFREESTGKAVPAPDPAPAPIARSSVSPPSSTTSGGPRKPPRPPLDSSPTKARAAAAQSVSDAAAEDQKGTGYREARPSDAVTSPVRNSTPTELQNAQAGPAEEDTSGAAAAAARGAELTQDELFAACREGDEATVQAYLLANACSERGLTACADALFDAYGDSVLHHAAQSGSTMVIKLLVNVGKVEADIPNARNETALQVASRRGHTGVVQTLLLAEADPNRRDSAGLTAFLSGVFSGASHELLNILLEGRADPAAQDSRGVGAIHFAALRGDSGMQHWLLECKANVDAQTEHSTTALMLVSKRGHAESVSTLLGCRANTSLADEAGCTAVMQALSTGNVDVATMIMDAGASLGAVDCAGRTALFHAVLGGKLEGLSAVVDRGARVNVLDEEGRSPLYQACLMGETVLAKRLLAAKADPNLAGKGTTVRPRMAQKGAEEGDNDDIDEDEREAGAVRACLLEARTCLQVCATLAHTELLIGLLEHEADVNAAPGALGWTSLHLCAAVGNDEGISVLLERGALTSLEDAEGNSAEVLAERAGHTAVLERLREARASQPQDDAEAADAPAPRRQQLGALPPIHAGPEAEAPPEETTEPLEIFKEEWQERAQDGSLLDRFCGPMVHDALESDQWRTRWEACTYLASHFADAVGPPSELVQAVNSIIATTAKDKVPKVFMASLSILEELLSDSRADVLSTEEFTALLRGQEPGDQPVAVNSPTGAGRPPDLVMVLLDQTDAAGGSSSASSFQQAAVDALCSCVLHGRVPLDEIALPLLSRIDQRLTSLAGIGEKDRKDRKEAALGPKCLTANLKLLSRWLSAFGLQQAGIFRRALVLPLLVRGVASEDSKVRRAATDALLQLMSLSGGVEERIWALLPSKARKAAERAVSQQQGVTLIAAVACEEDAMPKSVIVSEDGRAEQFLCVSELTPQLWASLEAATLKPSKGGSHPSRMPKSAQAAVAAAAAGASSPKTGRQSMEVGVAKPDDAAAEVLQQCFASKNWKERVGAIQALAGEFASFGVGVQLVEESVNSATDGAAEGGAGDSGGPLLSQYVLRGHRLSSLQTSIGTLLGDTVTAVFVAACGLLRLSCGHVPLYIAPLFLEPLLPPLATRLLDTSAKVRAKAVETAMEIAALHGCALSEMIVQCISSGSAWSNAPPQMPPSPAGSGGASGSGANGAAKSDSDRSIGPRLQLLMQLVQQAQQRGCTQTWTPDTWNALAGYAMKAADHRDNVVRKDSMTMLGNIRDQGDTAALIADRAYAQLEVLAQQRTGKRPGTTSTRLTTGSRLGTASRLGTSSRLGTGSRLGTSGTLGASGKLSNLGSTGRLSTGRVSTALNKSGRLGTAAKQREEAEESDNSVCSEPAPPAIPEGPDGAEAGGGAEADGVKFFNVQTACPGAEEIPELAEGEAALREVLPLAEPLDDIALDFVAPLVALFGDGWTRCFYSHHWQCRCAALLHLSASMGPRLQEARSRDAPATEIGELLDGAMRTVHEGLGDQNVHVYAEACRAITAAVPAFCSAVDGRLLVAHLAPLLRQLCARMGDAKETARMHTVQALFRLLRPPVGDIVTPVAIAALILRHLTPQKEVQDPTAPPTPTASAKTQGKGCMSGWLCRIATLRSLVKEYPKQIVIQPGTESPGEWLRLKDGLLHSDPKVRYEAARLYALVAKTHLRCLGPVEAQILGREAWASAISTELPAKTVAQVRKLLKLPDDPALTDVGGGAAGSRDRPKAANANASLPPPPAWDIPSNLADWAGCAVDQLAALRSPGAGDEKAVIKALQCLGKAACRPPDETARRTDVKVEDAFPGVCRAVQQTLSSPVCADKHVFMCALELCQLSVDKLSPQLSGLDLNMSLAKTFPVLLDRTSVADVKVAVASDRLVQQFAKHPKVGCEAVTKMVISSIARADRLKRPTMLLHTLLTEHGLRLCAQRDVVRLLLGAIAVQLERLAKDDGEIVEKVDAVRPQLIGVLSTCNQFSQETVHAALGEIDASQRKVVVAALKEAPNPRLVALGASAAEQLEETMGGRGIAVGSAVRAASRGREASPARNLERGNSGSSHALAVTSPRGPRSTGMGDSQRIRPPLPPSASPEASPQVRASAEASPTVRERRNSRNCDPSPQGHRKEGRRHRDRSARHGSSSPAPAGYAAPDDSPFPPPAYPGGSIESARGDGLGPAIQSSSSARRLLPLGSSVSGGDALRKWPSASALGARPDMASSRGWNAAESASNLHGGGRGAGSDTHNWSLKNGDRSALEKQHKGQLSSTADPRLRGCSKESNGEGLAGMMESMLASVDDTWKTR